MKKTALCAVAASLIAGGFSSASAQLRIGTVDMKQVFDSYYKTKDAEQKINEQRTSAKKELDDRMETYHKHVREVQQINEELKRAELSVSAREAMERERAEKVGAIKLEEKENADFRETREGQLQAQSSRMRTAIVEEINRVVTERVRSEQYDIVFDRSGPSRTGMPLLLYSKESYDFTSEVVTALNSLKRASEATPEPAVRPIPVPSPVKKPAK